VTVPTRKQDEEVMAAMARFSPSAGMTFGLLYPEVIAADDGWRDARILDAGIEGWLSPHVHASPQEAMDCPERESVLGLPTKP